MLPTSRTGVSGTSVEGSDLVSNTTGDVVRFSQTDNPASDLIQKLTGMQMGAAPQLAEWPVSRKDSLAVVFQSKLLSSCCNHGNPSQPNLTTCNFKSGLCDVLKGTTIPFQDLLLT